MIWPEIWTCYTTLNKLGLKRDIYETQLFWGIHIVIWDAIKNMIVWNHRKVFYIDKYTLCGFMSLKIWVHWKLMKSSKFSVKVLPRDMLQNMYKESLSVHLLTNQVIMNKHTTFIWGDCLLCLSNSKLNPKSQ